MTTYKYKGQSLSGAKVSGVVRAYDEFEAVAKLRDTCAFVTRLEEVKEKKSAFSAGTHVRIKEKELALICSQFSIILGTGLPVMRCVEMVASQSRNKRTRRMLEKVAEDIGAGYSMAQSFENNMPGLPKTFIETVRAGEQSGALEECFKRLHKYYDKTAKTKAKVISTLTYPAMVIAVAVIVVIIIMVKAIPAFGDVFAEMGTEMPAVTKGLIAVSNFFVGWWWLILLVLALLGGFAVVGVLLLLVHAMEKRLGREAMGGGDLKLLFVTGLFFGWKGNLFCLILACLIGIVWALLAARKSGESGRPIPWGPSIALGAWVTALAGEPFIRWYLSLL